jgi:SSS family solute:Na+ symporter
LLTTAGWVAAALVLPPESPEVLQGFVDKVQPGGPGWNRFPTTQATSGEWNVPRSLLMAFLGCVAVYSLLLGMGAVLFDGGWTALLYGAMAGLAIQGLLRLQKSA